MVTHRFLLSQTASRPIPGAVAVYEPSPLLIGDASASLGGKASSRSANGFCRAHRAVSPKSAATSLTPPASRRCADRRK
jgi:hypothetical protein